MKERFCFVVVSFQLENTGSLEKKRHVVCATDLRTPFSRTQKRGKSMAIIDLYVWSNNNNINFFQEIQDTVNKCTPRDNNNKHAVDTLSAVKQINNLDIGNRPTTNFDNVLIFVDHDVHPQLGDGGMYMVKRLRQAGCIFVLVADNLLVAMKEYHVERDFDYIISNLDVGLTFQRIIMAKALQGAGFL